MPFFNFSVDSALLRELGERLVGKPHIALAELVKNGFDADARNVSITLSDESIVVADNGHGMSRDEFRDYWMRIGSPHKREQCYSREFHRPLTGSKGVGRLAGQFLGRRMTIHTVAKDDPERELVGKVDWDKASQARDLTSAQVDYTEDVRRTLFPGNSRHGTKIVLDSLNQEWNEKDIRNLALEIWILQPPFRANPSVETELARDFTVNLDAADQHLGRSFKEQMVAILSLYHVKITGKLAQILPDGNGEVQIILEWVDGHLVKESFPIPNCRLHSADFQIRVYHLLRRQRQGVPVVEARQYLNEHGGVHIYDNNFHLPYYGPKEDWLGIEMDHAHRLADSRLLPEELQVSHGLTYLPTNSRLLGVVNISTGHERRRAEDAGTERAQKHLMVQITRDRLVDNEAFRQLAKMVRWSLDFYAMQEAAREFEQKKARTKTEPARDKFERVGETLERFKEQIEPSAYSALRKDVREAVTLVDEETEERIRQSSLLGALATAGMSAIAYRHELSKMLSILQRHIDDLRSISLPDSFSADRLKGIANSLAEWHSNASATQSLFLGVADAESRERRERWRASPLLDSVRRQVQLLIRTLPVDIDRVDPDLRLPEGTFVEWNAVFQNVIVNAANAVLDSPSPKIQISSIASRKSRAILVQDNGKGVDLNSADDLFKPFVRKLAISPERRAMGMGGSGIGLTIVRMLTENLESHAEFIQPESGFSTALCISWNETQ